MRGKQLTDERRERFNRILALLTTGPKVAAELREGTGTNSHTLQNDLYQLKANGRVAYGLDKLWRLADDPPATGTRSSSSGSAAPPPPLRTEGEAPPSKLTGHKPAAVAPKARANGHQVEDPPAMQASAAQTTESTDENPGPGPCEEPHADDCCCDECRPLYGHLVAAMEREELEESAPAGRDLAADLVKILREELDVLRVGLVERLDQGIREHQARRLELPEAPADLVLRIPAMDFTVADVDELGEQAGEVLHAGIVLMRAWVQRRKA